MKFLIKIQTDSELISYEAMALGFTLASFDHEVQFFIRRDDAVLADSSSRMYGMIQSLELYDIAKAWTDFDDETLAQLDDTITSQLTKPKQIDETLFDTVLTFS